MFATNCSEPKAQVHDVKSYQETDLNFKYPVNWKITEDVKHQDFRHLFVETSGNALVVIQVFFSGKEFNLPQYAANFAEAGKANVSMGK